MQSRSNHGHVQVGPNIQFNLCGICQFSVRNFGEKCWSGNWSDVEYLNADRFSSETFHMAHGIRGRLDLWEESDLWHSWQLWMCLCSSWHENHLQGTSKLWVSIVFFLIPGLLLLPLHELHPQLWLWSWHHRLRNLHKRWTWKCGNMSSLKQTFNF